MTGHFQEQYDRMKRSSKKLDDIDDVIHFVWDCYHLKDWIQNDPIVVKYFKSLSGKDDRKKGPRNKVEEYIDKSEYLTVIADIANASKHLTLTKKTRTGDKNIDIIKPPSHEDLIEIQKMVSIPIVMWGHQHRIRVDNNYIDISDLANGAIREWDKFIHQKKLSDHFGKYHLELIKKAPKK